MWKVAPVRYGKSPDISSFKNDQSPSRLAADWVSDSTGSESISVSAHYKVEITVPGGADPPLKSLLVVDRALRAR